MKCLTLHHYNAEIVLNLLQMKTYHFKEKRMTEIKLKEKYSRNTKLAVLKVMLHIYNTPCDNQKRAEIKFKPVTKMRFIEVK